MSRRRSGAARSGAHRSAAHGVQAPLPHPFSLPVVTGVLVLLLAAVGSLASTTTPAQATLASHRPSAVGAVRGAPSLSGVVSAGSGVAAAPLPGRTLRVSRDSERQALADSAGVKVERAAAAQAQQRNAKLAELAASAEKLAGKLASTGWQLPVDRGAYTLTARFGEGSSLWVNRHTGLDFAGPTGTPVHAVTSGTITYTGPAGAYGNQVILTDDQGTETWYCHLSAFGVRQGQKVTAGQVIARMGATGNTTGPHLHLEVRPGGGDPVDPFAALVAHGVQP